METRSTGLQKTKVIANQLSLGWLYLQSAKNLRAAYQAGRVTCARYFFLASYHACIDQSMAIFTQVLAAADGVPEGMGDCYGHARQIREQNMAAYDPRTGDDAAITATLPEDILDGLETCYRNLLEVVSAQLEAAHGGKLHVSLIEEATADDVDFLMEMLGGGCI